MPVPGPHAKRLASLSEKHRNQIESMLMEFDLGWTPTALQIFAGRLTAINHHPSHELALAELVKIDLQRAWAEDCGKRLDAYLEDYPELGNVDTVDVDLIVAEWDARRGAGRDADLDEYRSRFPRQFPQVQRIAMHHCESGVPQPQKSCNAGQASVDTSRMMAANDTVHESKRRKDSKLPKEFGRYRIVKKLGEGAMGMVFLAHDSQLDRHVALKTPSFSGANDEGSVARFYREARAAAKLQHRNICPVYDVGQINGRHFISMAFIKGRCMSDYIKPDRLPPQRTSAALVHRLSLALAEAHRHNVIHRDLKPANIMIDSKHEPVVMDFGLARQTDNESRLTQSGMAVGTPAYMSPEQIRGNWDEVGASSDIYALGVILYELLCGELPFRGAIAQVVYGIVNVQPVALSKRRPEINSSLESICEKMMAKSTGDRYQSMDQVALDLKSYLKDRRIKVQVANPSANSAPSVGGQSNQAGNGVSSAIGENAFSESEVLNAFFAAQSDHDSVRTAAEPTIAPQTTPKIQPVAKPIRNKASRPTKWIAASVIGLVALAGVIIYLPDGTRLEVPDDHGTKIEIGDDGKVDSVTVTPRPKAAVADEGSMASLAAPPETTVAAPEPPVDSTPSPYEVLTSPAWEWSEPKFLGRYLKDAKDLDVHLGSDFQQVYGSTSVHLSEAETTEGLRNEDLCVLSRGPRDSTWQSVVSLGGDINSPKVDQSPVLSPDGLELVFNSNRTSGISNQGDLWITARPSMNASWRRPELLGLVNTKYWEGQPEFAENGLAIYFSSRRTQNRDRNQLYVTRRVAIGSPWTEPLPLDGSVNVFRNLLFPKVSSDDRVLMFNAASESSIDNSYDIWLCRRDTADASWSSPTNLGQRVNTDAYEFPMALSEDGRSLLFYRVPAEGEGTAGHGTWVTHRIPKMQPTSGQRMDSFGERPADPVSGDRLAESGWIDLFNGKDLSGWQQVHKTDGWDVVNGDIVGRPRRKRERGYGWLQTDRSFMNFEFEFDYQLEPGANSGIFLRTVPSQVHSGASQLEIQLLDDKAPKFLGKLEDGQGTGSIWEIVGPNPPAQSLHRQTNTMRIRAVGSRITIHLNGKQILDADLDEYRWRIAQRFQYRQPGPLALQWHGERIRFRNLRVRELTLP